MADLDTEEPFERPARSRSRSFLVEDDDEDDIEAALARSGSDDNDQPEDDDDEDDLEALMAQRTRGKSFVGGGGSLGGGEGGAMSAREAASMSRLGMAGAVSLGSDYVPRHPPKPKPKIATPTGKVPDRLLTTMAKGLEEAAALSPVKRLTAEELEEQMVTEQENERMANAKYAMQGKRLVELDEQRRMEHLQAKLAAANAKKGGSQHFKASSAKQAAAGKEGGGSGGGGSIGSRMRARAGRKKRASQQADEVVTGSRDADSLSGGGGAAVAAAGDGASSSSSSSSGGGGGTGGGSGAGSTAAAAGGTGQPGGVGEAAAVHGSAADASGGADGAAGGKAGGGGDSGGEGVPAVPAEAAAAAAKREGSSGDDGGKTKSSKRVSLRRPRLGKRQGSAEKLAELAEEAAPGAAAAAGAAEKEKGKGSKGKGKKDKGERKSKAKKGKGKGKGKGESDSDTSGVSSSSDTEAVAPGGTDAARGTGASAAEAAEGGAASSSASANAAGAAVEGGAERVAAAASAAASAMIDAKPEKVKLLLLGDSGVGKSSIMSRFAEDTFTEQMLSTAGVDFSAKTLSLDGKKVTVSIWDTAGQERFRKITQAYYRGAHGILLVYDVSDRGSFDNVGFWMENISRATCRTAPAVLIVGNKIDLERAVPTEEGAAAAEKYDVQFFETSAKEGKNVHDAVLECARKALDAKLFGGVPQVQGGGGMPGDARRGKGDKNEKCILM